MGIEVDVVFSTLVQMVIIFDTNESCEILEEVNPDPVFAAGLDAKFVSSQEGNIDCFIDSNQMLEFDLQHLMLKRTLHGY